MLEYRIWKQANKALVSFPANARLNFKVRVFDSKSITTAIKNFCNGYGSMFMKLCSSIF